MRVFHETLDQYILLFIPVEAEEFEKYFNNLSDFKNPNSASSNPQNTAQRGNAKCTDFGGILTEILH